MQLCLQSTACKVGRIWAIANPHLTMQFESRSQGVLVHDTWVDVAKLGAENYIQDLCVRGFKFPTNGMMFNVGTVTTQGISLLPSL